MKKLLVAFMATLFLFVLTACGDSTEESIVGSWQLIEGGKKSNYWEMTEDKLTIKSRTGETLQSMKYIITDLQDDEFKFEIIEPLNNNQIVFFEGYFENKDTIKSIRYSLGDFELIRVDDIEKKLVDIKDKEYNLEDIEKSIVGYWKQVNIDNGNIGNYIEITEDKFTFTTNSGEDLWSIEYIIAETQDGKFILDSYDRETGDKELIFGGYFEDNDTIIMTKLVGDPKVNAKIVRVDKEELEEIKAE